MTSIFPNQIRTWPTHLNGVEFVDAAHVNELQDEIRGLSQNLGVMPHVYTNVAGAKTTYKDIVTRLNTVQKDIDQLDAYVDDLVDASRTGWNLPIASVYGSGTPIPSTVDPDQVSQSGDWHKVKFTQAIQDTDGVFSSGFYLTCPRTGWWIVNMLVTMQIPGASPLHSRLDHVVFTRLKLIDGAFELAKGSTSAKRGSGGWHRINAVYSGDWYQGEKMYLEVRHTDDTGGSTGLADTGLGSLTASLRGGLTYIRALPPDMEQRPAWTLLPDEINP